jgi:transaldolase
MISERLLRLHEAGQAIWLDYIDRGMLRSGELARRIRDDSLTGLTSNPTIFEKALAQGNEYDAQVRAADDLSSWELFELLATDDVRTACDAFAGVYRATAARDGYVSVEVSPGVARDARATVREARRLWNAIERPNVMVKVPGTEEGIDALGTLIAEGININVTLLFSVDTHARVIDSYMRGLEARVAEGRSVSEIASVASFFVSRVDTEVDRRLASLLERGLVGQGSADALRGRIAIANARLAYEGFQRRFDGPRWRALEAKGAMVQRPLWASTSTKNPAFSDVLYVEQLIGPDTVNTMPPATLDAFRDHGQTARTVDSDMPESQATMAKLAACGVAIDEVTAKLLEEGLASFQKSFDSLIVGLESKSASLRERFQASL